jgi:hypothetical protein
MIRTLNLHEFIAARHSVANFELANSSGAYSETVLYSFTGSGGEGGEPPSALNHGIFMEPPTTVALAQAAHNITEMGVRQRACGGTAAQSHLRCLPFLKPGNPYCRAILAAMGSRSHFRNSLL